MDTREFDKKSLSSNKTIVGKLNATPFTAKESDMIRRAVKLSRKYRPDFYHAAIISYSEKIIAKHEASLSRRDNSSEREASSCQEANNV